MDWCQKEEFHGETNLKTNKLNSELLNLNFLGFYVCHIPESCCAPSVNEYNVSTELNR